jgi:hypothetical protein
MNCSAILALAVAFLSYQWGQHRRALGQPVTWADRWMIGVYAWAAAWLFTGFPPLFRDTVMSSFNKQAAAAAILGIAFAPLAVTLLIRTALRLVRRAEGRLSKPVP